MAQSYDPRPETWEPSATPEGGARHAPFAGLWTAELIGLIGTAAQDYARTVHLPGRASLAEIQTRVAQILSTPHRKSPSGDGQDPPPHG